MNSTSKPTATDTIDAPMIGAAAATFAFVIAVLRVAVTNILGRYPEPFAGIPGVIWWTCFIAGIGIAAVCIPVAIFMLVKGE